MKRMSFELKTIELYSSTLSCLPDTKLLINTINAHSYNVAQKDVDFAKALSMSDVLLPDGISVVWAKKILSKNNHTDTINSLKKIAGEDLFVYEMKRLQICGGSCFFLGSSEVVLNKIKKRAALEYPSVEIHTYSPPYTTTFSDSENLSIIQAINSVQPDVLFVGMTAPKQEKWTFQHFEMLKAGHVCSIGAVFDMYAGTVSRAPRWMIRIGLEWLFRLVKEPTRMWRRYLIGNFMFVGRVLIEKIKK